jgi:stage II sporulation protein D
VEALYHSDCGGHTASADDVWGNKHVPYLTGAPDDVQVTHRTWRFDAPVDRVRAALNQDDRSAVGRSLNRIAITTRDSSGRAARVQVRGDRASILRGEDVRAILNRAFGDRAIMSTRFSVVRIGTTYRFTGTGFGHGVGLCQTGAAARASRGADMTEILTVYFPGAALTRLSADRRTIANPADERGLALLESP